MDYNPIFNKMTRDTFDKFIETYGLKVEKGTSKTDFQNGLLKIFREDLFAERNFCNFYKELEEAGRKHLYIYKFSSEHINRSNIGFISECLDEEERTFDPIKDNGKIYFRKEKNARSRIY